MNTERKKDKIIEQMSSDIAKSIVNLLEYVNSQERSIMTDLEKFIDTYKQFGIDLICKKIESSTVIYLNGGDDCATYSNKLKGYCGFYSYIEFDQNGKFLTQEFYEY